jgi:transcriptional regulator with XRE-family HTH domain
MVAVYYRMVAVSSTSDNMSRHEFAVWLQRQLQRREMTQADFARRLNTSSGVVNRWIREERTPSPANCDLIADVLHVDRDEVLALAGHRPLDLELAPDDPRRDLKALIDRVAWDEERVDTVRGMLGRWYDHDQNKKRKKGTL